MEHGLLRIGDLAVGVTYAEKEIQHMVTCRVVGVLLDLAADVANRNVLPLQVAQFQQQFLGLLLAVVAHKEPFNQRQLTLFHFVVGIHNCRYKHQQRCRQVVLRAGVVISALGSAVITA